MFSLNQGQGVCALGFVFCEAACHSRAFLVRSDVEGEPRSH